MSAARYILVLILLTTLSPGYALQCATSRCYSDVYQSVDPEDLPVLKRVEHIYRTLCKTIGSQQANRSKLLVIDSNGYPWAVALSDNTVVLTKGAIELMYAESDFELGDARVAFVLGHELSHLGTEDLYHHRAFSANTNNPANNWLRPRPEEELRADLRGYTFATIAGFKTGRLLAGKDDFFKFWLSQIGNIQGDTHPDLEVRGRFLREGFNKILQDVPYYQFATLLAHFGHYRDAQHLFEDFLNLVETKEVYSNLGYVHLQQAREKMPVELAYKYWIPTLLEPNSGLEINRTRSLFEGEMPPQALHHLQKAEQRLKLAIDMNEEELTSYINLAAVYLYMPGKIHRAYAAIEDARQTPFGQLPSVRDQLESIYQLIRIQDDADNEDRWPKARDTLANLARKPNTPDNLLYNLARMLDERGRDNTATPYWQRLHERLHALPESYQTLVCTRLRDTSCNGDTTKSSTPWQASNIPLGRDIRYPDVQEYLQNNWNTNRIPGKELPELKAQVFTNKAGDSLLALDDHIEMMIQRNVPGKFTGLQQLISTFGLPQASLPVPSGQLLSFGSGWSAFVKDNEVVELWISELRSTP